MDTIKDICNAIKEAYKTCGCRYPIRFIKIARGVIPGSNLSKYLRSYAENLNRNYGLKFGVKKIFDDDKPFYTDTKYSILLRDEPKDGIDQSIALIGFDIEEGLALKVKQIQAVSGFKSYLPPKWERMLLDITKKWASRLGFKQIRVIKAENNHWYKKKYYLTEEDKELNKRLKIRYNVTAKRSGFKYNKILDIYISNLE